MSHGRITSDDDARRYILGGHGAFTLVSPSRRFTFEGALRGPRLRLSTRAGPEAWRPCGFLPREGGLWGPGPHPPPAQTPEAAIAWTAWRLWRWPELAGSAPYAPTVEVIEIWHDGSCGRCGRQLTTPESVARGLGPVCAGRS